MVEFKLVDHSIRRNVQMVEVYVNGRFRATITPDHDKGSIRVVSTHLADKPTYLTDLAGDPRMWEFQFD